MTKASLLMAAAAMALASSVAFAKDVNPTANPTATSPIPTSTGQAPAATDPQHPQPGEGSRIPEKRTTGQQPSPDSGKFNKTGPNTRQ